MSRDRTAALLRVRAVERDAARGALQRALTAEQGAADRHADLARALAEATGRPGPADAAALTGSWELQRLRALEVRAAEAAVAAAGVEVTGARDGLVACDRRLTAIERWDARRRRLRADERRRAEQNAADELAAARHGRTTTGGAR